MIGLALVGFAMVTILSKFRSRSKTKRAKKRKIWGTSIPVRGPFRVAKCAGWVPTPELQARANAYRAERLKNETAAEREFKQILLDMGWRDFEREAIHYYPRSFCIFDFWFPKLNVVLEVDGLYHEEKSQHDHDVGRDRYCDSLGIKTVRVPNAKIFQERAYVAALVKRALGVSPC